MKGAAYTKDLQDRFNVWLKSRYKDRAALDLAWAPFGLTRLEVYQTGRGILCFHNRSLPSPAGSGML